MHYTKTLFLHYGNYCAISYSIPFKAEFYGLQFLYVTMYPSYGITENYFAA